MPKVFTSPNQKIGEEGENVAAMFLVKQGYSITERNYTKKWGELDIVAQKDKVLYFVEVKSVSRNLSWQKENLIEAPEEENNEDAYRAEDNMHTWKAQRMARTIQTYLLAKKVPEEMEWEVMLLVVYLDMQNKKARIKVVKNIIL